MDFEATGEPARESDLTDIIPQDVEDVFEDPVIYTQHRLASYVLEHKARVLPGQATIRKLVEGSLRIASFLVNEDSANRAGLKSSNDPRAMSSPEKIPINPEEQEERWRKRTKELRERRESVRREHLEDFRALCAIQAFEYVRATAGATEMEWIERTKGGATPKVTDDIAHDESESSRSGYLDYFIRSEWTQDVETLNHAYLSRLVSIGQQEEEVERERLEWQLSLKKRFPLSRQEFEQKDEKSQLKVARYLMCEDDEEKERQRGEHGWDLEHTRYLEDELLKGGEFKTGVLAIIRAG